MSVQVILDYGHFITSSELAAADSSFHYTLKWFHEERTFYASCQQLKIDIWKWKRQNEYQLDWCELGERICSAAKHNAHLKM